MTDSPSTNSQQAASVHFDVPPKLAGSVVAVGAFDGVHRGHRTLIAQAIASAADRAVPSVVWTFDPPPKVFFRSAIQLMSIYKKLEVLQGLRPDMIVVSRFDAAFRKRSAEDFIDAMATIAPLEIHVGPDFRFGVRQSGNVDKLKEHFTVRVLDLVLCQQGEAISSSRIRKLLQENDLHTAQSLLR